MHLCFIYPVHLCMRMGKTLQRRRCMVFVKFTLYTFIGVIYMIAGIPFQNCWFLTAEKCWFYSTACKRADTAPKSGQLGG